MNRQILREIEDEDWFEFSQWPTWAKSSYLKRHKNRAERFNLWLFFWRNGMLPERATHFVLIHGGYDQDAYRSLISLERQSETEAGREYLSRPRMFDMILGRPTPTRADHEAQIAWRREQEREAARRRQEEIDEAIEIHVRQVEEDYFRRKYPK